MKNKILSLIASAFFATYSPNGAYANDAAVEICKEAAQTIDLMYAYNSEIIKKIYDAPKGIKVCIDKPYRWCFDELYEYLHANLDTIVYRDIGMSGAHRIAELCKKNGFEGFEVSDLQRLDSALTVEVLDEIEEDLIKDGYVLVSSSSFVIDYLPMGGQLASEANVFFNGAKTDLVACHYLESYKESETSSRAFFVTNKPICTKVRSAIPYSDESNERKMLKLMEERVVVREGNVGAESQ